MGNGSSRGRRVRGPSALGAAALIGRDGDGRDLRDDLRLATLARRTTLLLRLLASRLLRYHRRWQLARLPLAMIGEELGLQRFELPLEHFDLRLRRLRRALTPTS